MPRPLLLVCALLFAPIASAAEPVPRTISVTGTGEVAAVPDLVTVTLGVTATARTAAAALSANSAAMQAVLDQVAAEGIAPRDVQTSQLSLNPVWQGDRNPRIESYEARNLVTIRVREIARLGALLDRLAKSGANQIVGLGFSHAEPLPLLDAARRAAVADARARALLYAEAAGVRLGAVLSISESSPGYAPVFYAARAEAAAPVPVAAGETTLSASVAIVFGILGEQ